MTHRLCMAALAGALGLLSPDRACAGRAPVPQPASKPAARAVVVFGGFGYFDEARQAWLAGLIRRDAAGRSRFAEDGAHLESTLVANARRLFEKGAGGAAFARWTAHGVVFDQPDLSRAFTAATGAAPVGTREMFAEFDRAYMVVLSSGFEHHGTLRVRNDGGVQYSAQTIVSVSASLVDIRGSGDILLSTTSLGQTERHLLPAPDPPDSSVWAGRYVRAYLAAADQALTMLRAQAERLGPEAIERATDTYMVTGAVVPKRTGAVQAANEFAARIFAWKQADEIGTFCVPADGCAEGSTACQAMTGLLVGATSQALSQAGRRVLPPMTWRAGIRSIDDLARYRLILPNTPLPDLASSTELDFNPKRATYKVVATLEGLSVTRASIRDKSFAIDAYGAFVNARVGRTDPRTCESRPADERWLGEKRAGFAVVYDNHPVAEPPLDDASRRLLSLRAIHDATATIAVSLGRP